MESSASIYKAPNPTWKPDWDQARRNLTRWWNNEGLAINIFAPLPVSRVDGAEPTAEPDNPRKRWIDPEFRSRLAEYHIARRFLGGDAVPHGYATAGPGDLAAMLTGGSQWKFSSNTVWYEPSITSPDTHPPLRFDPNSEAFVALSAMLRRQKEVAAGRYLIGIPDLVENLDIVAAVRGSEPTMFDLTERPEWVLGRIEEVNEAYFAAFDAFHSFLADEDGGNVFSAFSIWGPGKTAKVQCDACVMLSPKMFKKFVVPALERQCQWLDYAMYHLDGEQALIHLDTLLSIEPLQAIEWTPVGCYTIGEGGGHPKWYDLYRRIINAGKSVQAINVHFHEVIPLLDAVGGRGMSIFASAPDLDSAEKLLERVAAYR